jgi:hypothetical protein
MKSRKPKIKHIFLALLLCLCSLADAQEIYTDYKPEYKEWRSNYIIDKIQYTKDEIIFFFRYYSYSNGTIVDFWFRDSKQYCLENVENPDETFYTTDLKNIRVGGSLKCVSMKEANLTNFNTVIPANVTITCEVHFPRIPNHIAKVHFLEGKNYRKLSNHFHAFEVKMKQWNDKNLGTPEDRLERLATFESRNFNDNYHFHTRTIYYGYVPNKNVEYDKEAKIRM